MRAVGRHEAAYLGHDDVESRLTEQGRLTGHVRAGNHHNLRGLVGELDGIADVGLAGRKLALDDGMTGLDETDVKRVVHDRTVVLVVDGDAREGVENVEAREHRRVELQRRDVAGHEGHELGVEPLLDDLDFLLSAEDALLVVLEFGSDVSLGVDERLLAYPLRRHLGLVGVGDLDVVSEDVVEAYL